jgi:hypothetical protein
LVDDPEGYHPELQSDIGSMPGLEAKLDLWLVAGAEKFRQDAVLKHALLTLARHEQSRDCLLLLEAVLETPGLMSRLMEVLRPAGPNEAAEAEVPSNADKGKARSSKAQGAPGKRRKVVER